MSSEEIGLVPTQNALNSQLVFQDENLRFSCGAPPQRRVGDSGPKTRELTGFIDDRLFAPQSSDFRRTMYNENPERRDPREPQNWNSNGADTTPSGEGSDEDEDDEDDDVDDDDEVDEGDAEVGGLVGADKGIASNKANNGEDKMGNGKVKHQQHQQHSSFGGTVIVGSSREVLLKDHSVGQQTVNNNTRTRGSPSDIHSTQQGRLGSYRNAVTVAEPDSEMYYSHYLQVSEGTNSAQKDLVVENGCGFSGRKDVMYSSESGDSLRGILSDPMTGALMDDAMILPCGHSFGGGGIQHVVRMKACSTCSQSISEDSIAPNLSLRAAVQAFRREEELQFYRASKRRRERIDQEKGAYGDSVLVDTPRGRGVQFPFAVTDRVIIKGNKRTPQRFVGREAVVTTQCLNGWYVVKTLDNAESVKLQYRSLAKVSDDSASKPMPSKMAPNWL